MSPRAGRPAFTFARSIFQKVAHMTNASPVRMPPRTAALLSRGRSVRPAARPGANWISPLKVISNRLARAFGRIRSRISADARMSRTAP